jgi:hypothetical protein
MTRATAALLLTMLVFVADGAFAQSAFVEGGFVIDSRRFSGQADDRVFDGNVATIMIGAGDYVSFSATSSIRSTSASLLKNANATRTRVRGPAACRLTFTRSA